MILYLSWSDRARRAPQEVKRGTVANLVRLADEDDIYIYIYIYI